MGGRGENDLLEMNKRGAAGDLDYIVDTDEWGRPSADDRSQPSNNYGGGRVTNGTYDRNSNNQSNFMNSLSRYDESKVSFSEIASVRFFFSLCLLQILTVIMHVLFREMTQLKRQSMTS